MLLTLVILLSASVALVPLSRRLGLGSVLGYLVGGALIGPSGLRLITNVGEISAVAELGVVMLLFLIGLEVRPQRLWVLRRAVFGLGLAQVAVTGVVIAGALYAFGAGGPSAMIVGAGLALSSTAIVLPMLGERNLLGSAVGRDGFAVLLFQDLAFIPLVALVPLFAGQGVATDAPWRDLAMAIAAIAIILGGGRYLTPIAFRAIGGARIPEVFVTLALLIVVGAATIAAQAGLSMSLGAFLAGVLLSGSAYRHEVQADVEPFEGILLGFFFLSVGMSADLGLALSDPWFFVAATPGLMIVKALVAFLVGRVGKQSNLTALRFAAALPQGSEFSFVLFGAAIAVGAMSQSFANRATLTVAFSMALTPVVFAASERFLAPLLNAKQPKAPYDKVQGERTPVIICGFGRVGQIVGRLLRMRGVAFTALDEDSEQVEVVRRFGGKVYFGNPKRLDILRAAGAEQAKLLVLAMDDEQEALDVADLAQRNFPDLRILARARNRRHAHLLMDHGVDQLVRETFHSSLKLGEMALIDLGVSDEEARRAVQFFADYDERNLIDTHAHYDDERRLIQSSKQAADELAALFEADLREHPAPG